MGLAAIQELLYRLYMIVTGKNPKLQLRDHIYVGKPGETFSCDDSLPSLPVPPLQETLKKYLDSVRPHVTDEEYAKTSQIVESFGKGIGVELQEKLLKKAGLERNWLSKWWEDAAYLSNRASLLPNLNMTGGVLEKFVNPNRETWLDFGALNIHYFLHFWKLLRSERLRAFYNGKAPWTNHLFRNLWSTCRIPGIEKDELACYFNPESSGKPTPTHLVVLYKGHIFSFEAVDQNEDPFTAPEISKQLKIISDICHAEGDGAGVAALSSADRPTWAKNRTSLIELDPNNQKILDIIATSIMAICMDDAEPKTADEALLLEFVSDCRNRWADKSSSIHIFRNGVLGSTADHAPIDGMVCVSLCNFAFMSLEACELTWKGTKKIRDMQPPQRLEFKINDQIRQEIVNARQTHEKESKNLQVRNTAIHLYGKSLMKPHRIHPDVYLQLVLQLAFYKMHRRFVPTYMSVSTRQYHNGRTETCRSCTMPVVEWIKAMNDPSVSDSERQKLLYFASDHLLLLRAECMKGYGCDRHLLGLYLLAMESGKGVPELFQDPSYSKSGGGGNFTLSTSFTGFTELVGGVAPMCEDGYSAFYSIEDNKVTVLLAAYNSCPETCVDKYYKHIKQALVDLQQLLVNTKHSNSKCHK